MFQDTAAYDLIHVIAYYGAKELPLSCVLFFPVCMAFSHRIYSWYAFISFFCCCCAFRFVCSTYILEYLRLQVLFVAAVCGGGGVVVAHRIDIDSSSRVKCVLADRRHE